MAEKLYTLIRRYVISDFTIHVLSKKIAIKIKGLKRKPEKYFGSYCRILAVHFTGLFGLGFLGNVLETVLDNLYKVFFYISKFPMDIKILFIILRGLFAKIVALLRPAELWRIILSLPQEIKHISYRLSALMTLYWRELRNIVKFVTLPKLLVYKIKMFLVVHIHNKNRIIRGIIGVIVTLLCIRLFVLLSPYLYLILPAVIIMNIKLFLPAIYSMVAGFVGRCMGKIAIRVLRRKFQNKLS